MTEDGGELPMQRSREHRRRRFRRHRRRAYIRSVYFLPSLATLGNAISGFAAIYVAGLDPLHEQQKVDRLTHWFSEHNFSVAVCLIFAAMLFDALDGRLARFARHTTDFGGQLDSLADVISFGAAPAFIALQVFKNVTFGTIPISISRLVWAIGALYLSCAAMRLARFNVSNEHGEQHHFSFLGLPSPGAAGAVAAFVLMQQELKHDGFLSLAYYAALWLLPLVVLGTGLLMVSSIRYSHLVNRFLRGRRPIGQILIGAGVMLALFITWPLYTIGIGALAYAFSGLFWWLLFRWRRQNAPLPGVTSPP